MELSTRVRVRAVVDSISSAVSGGKAFHEIAAGMLRGLDWAREHLQTADTSDKVDALLDGLEEPSPEGLRRFEAMSSLIPGAINRLVRQKLQGSLTDLPGLKMGRKTIPNSEKRAICDQVAALVRSGCTPGAAKFRVAQRSGCTVRTVSRVWSKRGEFASDVNADEVQAMVEALFAPGQELEGNVAGTARGNSPADDRVK